MKATVIRRERFSAAHRLYRPDWDDEKNMQVFGKCSWKNYHGHNYLLEVRVTGEIDPETGFVMNLSELKEMIRSVLQEFDHKNLNLDVPEFRELLPSTENLAVVLWNRLRNLIPAKFDLEIYLEETDKNAVVYRGK